MGRIEDLKVIIKIKFDDYQILTFITKKIDNIKKKKESACLHGFCFDVVCVFITVFYRFSSVICYFLPLFF